jgi:hypothetical protein
MHGCTALGRHRCVSGSNGNRGVASEIFFEQHRYPAVIVVASLVVFPLLVFLLWRDRLS